MKTHEFQSEIALFEKHLSEWLEQHEGKFALVRGDSFEIFETEEAAINTGLSKYGADSGFLVRCILAKQPEVSIPALSLGLINARN